MDNRRVLGRRHARGFTLVELMVGLAVIGILHVVALPFYKGYRERMAISLAVRNY